VHELHLKRRLLAAFFCAFSAAAAFAAAVEDAASVRALLAAGARELALARIESLQPRDSSAPRWAEWESLRCEALGRLNRREALLERVNAIPQERISASLNACLVEAARAALGQNDPVAARAHTATVLWRTSASAADVRAARLVIIDSYVAERRGQDAFGSMLRFQQDYGPLDAAIGDRFAQALLDLGLNAEALNWVRTNEVTPARLVLQLRSGSIAPEAAIAQARAGLPRDSAYWRAIQEAATRSRNASLEIEALERLLQSTDGRDAGGQARAAERLSHAYLSTAADVGNREQLLAGDDGAWADLAARRLASDPSVARAFYASLAQRARTADARHTAQLQLVHSLNSAGLDQAALRVMQRIAAEVDALDPQARYLLGTIASKHNDAALALKLWSGLPTPPALNPIEWQLTLATTAFAAGDADASVNTLKRLLDGRTAVSPQLAQRVLALGQEMLDMRVIDSAQTVYELLVRVAPEAQAREALFGLGRTHELAGEPVPAAAHYLRSALLVQGATSDALALQARLLAGLNLMRAGLKDDARAQFEWLLRNAKEPPLVEAAKRALSRL
jgi:hypothetical protein